MYQLSPHPAGVVASTAAGLPRVISDDPEGLAAHRRFKIAQGRYYTPKQIFIIPHNFQKKVALAIVRYILNDLQREPQTPLMIGDALRIRHEGFPRPDDPTLTINAH
jgi:hypothetical protein